MQGNLAPLRSAIDEQKNVSNLGGLKHCSGDSGAVELFRDVEQSGKIESPARATEIAEFAGEFLLLSDPRGIGGRSKGSDSCLTEGRRGVSPQHFAQRFELQHTGGVVDESGRHSNLWYRNGGKRWSKAETREWLSFISAFC